MYEKNIKLKGFINDSYKESAYLISDKKGIVKFASALNDAGIEIISTGGTFSELKNANIDVKDVSSVTSFPEILDGRVKPYTLKIQWTFKYTKQ